MLNWLNRYIEKMKEKSIERQIANDLAICKLSYITLRNRLTLIVRDNDLITAMLQYKFEDFDTEYEVEKHFEHGK